jgi:hypothetical protein
MFLILYEGGEAYTRKQLLADDLAIWDEGCAEIFKFEGEKVYQFIMGWVEVKEGT